MILMDVGLPMLGGIEAARHIRQFVPRVEDCLREFTFDPAMVGVFYVFGGGYVLKADAQMALLQAMEAVRLGKYFYFSPSLSDITSR